MTSAGGWYGLAGLEEVWLARAVHSCLQPLPCPLPHRGALGLPEACRRAGGLTGQLHHCRWHSQGVWHPQRWVHHAVWQLPAQSTPSDLGNKLLSTGTQALLLASSPSRRVPKQAATGPPLLAANPLLGP